MSPFNVVFNCGNQSANVMEERSMRVLATPIIDKMLKCCGKPEMEVKVSVVMVLLLQINLMCARTVFVENHWCKPSMEQVYVDAFELICGISGRKPFGENDVEEWDNPDICTTTGSVDIGDGIIDVSLLPYFAGCKQDSGEFAAIVSVAHPTEELKPATELGIIIEYSVDFDAWPPGESNGNRCLRYLPDGCSNGFLFEKDRVAGVYPPEAERCYQFLGSYCIDDSSGERVWANPITDQLSSLSLVHESTRLSGYMHEESFGAKELLDRKERLLKRALPSTSLKMKKNERNGSLPHDETLDAYDKTLLEKKRNFSKPTTKAHRKLQLYPTQLSLVSAPSKFSPACRYEEKPNCCQETQGRKLSLLPQDVLW
ncbi:hypothetical protein B0H34DRAFT_824356 [Crassisporium funariophilum]|nr:hypothetical protein B0H34DRAFT_824356 [Crassisporium funariophilum]